MRAKFIREVTRHDGLFGYYTTYEFECIECGNHYLHHYRDGRVSPFCIDCQKKHARLKAKERAEKRKQKKIDEVLDKIRAEIHATAEMHEDGDYYLRDEWIDWIIDKYKAESEE